MVAGNSLPAKARRACPKFDRTADFNCRFIPRRRMAFREKEFLHEIPNPARKAFDQGNLADSDVVAR